MNTSKYGPYIIIQGCADFDGSLIIDIPNHNESITIEYNLIKYSCYEGKFNDIVIVDSSTNSQCDGDVLYRQSFFSITVGY